MIAELASVRPEEKYSFVSDPEDRLHAHPIL